MPVYRISAFHSPILIDADWNKTPWQSIEPLLVNQAHPASSDHLPQTQVKAAYYKQTLYVIFRVEDRYIRALTTEMHGPVYKDSCVEFFFSPHPSTPDSYFNIEINSCGVLLASHHSGPRQGRRYLEADDGGQIQIAGSLRGPIRSEITCPLTWTLEYAVPLEMLSRYAEVDAPAPGVVWNANFYKCADDTSHPHWMMWSEIPGNIPDFHRPEYFGYLQFT
jgi:hypothetical protein